MSHHILWQHTAYDNSQNPPISSTTLHKERNGGKVISVYTIQTTIFLFILFCRLSNRGDHFWSRREGSEKPARIMTTNFLKRCMWILALVDSAWQLVSPLAQGASSSNRSYGNPFVETIHIYLDRLPKLWVTSGNYTHNNSLVCREDTMSLTIMKGHRHPTFWTEASQNNTKEKIFKGKIIKHVSVCMSARAVRNVLSRAALGMALLTPLCVELTR